MWEVWYALEAANHLFVPGVTAAPELLGCGVWRTVCTMPNRASSVSSGSKVLRVGMTTCGS